MKKNKNQDKKPEKREEVDFDKLWEQAEEERKKLQEAKRIAWIKSRERLKEKAKYSPFLVVPCSLSDYGNRPIQGQPHWSSPFIGVMSPDPTGKPKAGVENYLTAQVFNLGAASSAPTKVDFYWADPSLGLTAENFNLIGTEWVEILPMSSKMVSCRTPWIPQYVNEGHECIMVNTSNHILDPIIQPFDPRNDRHVGQKNMSVLPADISSFSLWVPMSMEQLPVHINAVALKIQLEKEFEVKETPYQTILAIADHVMNGFQKRSPEEKRPFKEVAVDSIKVTNIDPQKIIRTIKITDKRKPIGATIFNNILCDYAGNKAADRGHFLFEMPLGFEAAAKVDFDFQELNIKKNELIVMDLNHSIAGMPNGGFTTVFCAPQWLLPTNLSNQKYNDMKDDSIEKVILMRCPETRIAYQLTNQLQKHLPIKSFDHLLKELSDGLVVDDQRISLNIFRPYVPEEIFPIENVKDLALKMVAGTTMAMAEIKTSGTGIVKQEGIRNILTTGMGNKMEQKTPIPSGHFTGPSIYGSETSK